jgi:hypothetical protein
MTLSSPTTAVGVFDEQGQAAKAIQALKHAGFGLSQIGVASRELSQQLEGVRVDEQHAADKGAVTGALLGGSLGVALGLVGSVLIPGAIPILAGHALLSALGGGLAGAAGGVFAGPFIAMGFSEQDAQKHAHHVEQGRTVLLVYAPDRRDEARWIMVEHGAYDDSMAEGP